MQKIKVIKKDRRLLCAFVGVLVLVVSVWAFTLMYDAEAKVGGGALQMKRIVTGNTHTCAIASDNKAYCWGQGTNGRLGTGTTDNQTSPMAVSQGAMPAGTTIRQISASASHTCAIASDNKAYCWGNGSSGRLGNGGTAQQTSPVAVSQGAMPAGTTIRQISAGFDHTCAVASDHKAYCWGYGENGRLGNGATGSQTTPVAVSQGAMPAGTTIRQISAGFDHTCAIASDNNAYCWGAGTNGRLGNGGTAQQTTPVAVSQGAMPAGGTVKEISTGNGHTCAIVSDNKAYCWGYGTDGQLGNGSTAQQTTPVAVSQGDMPVGATIRQMDASTTHTCAVASDNKAYCWGAGTSAQLGNNLWVNQTTPVAVSQGAMPAGATTLEVAVGGFHTCSVASDNKAYCWGNGGSGRLGSGSLSNQTTPGVVSAIIRLIEVAQSVYRAYGPSVSTLPGSPLAATNTPATLGEIAGDFRLRIGLINSEELSLNIDTISVGANHSCAIASNGKAYCWGYGGNGELGNGSTENQTTPVAVSQGAMPAGATIRQIDAGFYQTCAIASDNKAYCWGDGSAGKLGNGLDTNQSTPVAVSKGDMPTGATVLQITTGADHTCAIASDNKAYCWGYGGAGQLGNGTTSGYQATPVAVSMGAMTAGTTIRQISALFNHTCVVASDNKAYCWGDGTNGRLGNGSTSQQTTPVAVSMGAMTAGTTIRQISAGGDHTCAVASDNKGYCWGNGSNGRLGNGDFAPKTTPVAVLQGTMPSGAMINQISAGDGHTCAVASDNMSYCWGYGGAGQFGNGTTSSYQDTPLATSLGAMPSGATVRRIASGSGHTCAVASDNMSYCWGYNGYGQLGDTSTTDRTAPVVTSQGAIEDDSAVIATDQLDLSLEVAPLGLAGTCNAVATGWEAISMSSAMVWGSAPPSHGTVITSFGSDPSAPTSSGYVYQTVVQNGGFTNSQPIGPQQTALWDVVLHDRSSRSATDYCIRIVSDDSGAMIDTYDHYPHITTAPGSLTLQFVDDDGTPLDAGNTATQFSPLVRKLEAQDSTGTLTDSTSKQLEAHNSTSESGWSVSLAAADGSMAVWQSGSDTYAYNAASSVDGQLSVDMSGSSHAAYGVTPTDEVCDTTNVTRGSSSTYSNTVSAITLLTGSPSAQFNCRWRVRGIVLSQTIPPGQPAGSYTLDMIATIVAS